MSKMVDLEKLSALETEIDLLEKRKLSLQYEIENLTKECNELKDKTEKELAQKRHLCDVECREKVNEANKLLKEAEAKLKTAVKRDEDLKVIEQQIEELNKKQKAFADTQKETEAFKVSCLDREKRAELIIQQFEQKIKDLETANKK